ncbi:MAG: hypothetical protein JWR07_583, partial [Nevskia sp.]|nr:hypothetical protein [Nevskia sp.]
MSASDFRPSLLVLASTYPRWRGDSEPGFVHELCRRLTGSFKVIAVVPSSPSAAAHELLDGVEVFRFRYAPRRLETLVNDGGIVANLRRNPWKLMLLPSFVVGQAWLAARLFRRFRFAAVHAHWLIPQGLVAAWLCRKRRAPFLVTSHGADLFALRGRGFEIAKRLVIRRAAALTVVSTAMRDELERLGADSSKVSVAPMGVDLRDRFTLSNTAQRSAHQILFVGRLVEKKGARYLVEAMPMVLRQHPQARLSIAGFGPEQMNL